MFSSHPNGEREQTRVVKIHQKNVTLSNIVSETSNFIQLLDRRLHTVSNDVTLPAMHLGSFPAVVMLVLLLAASTVSCGSPPASPEARSPSGKPITFNKHVAPIIFENCSHCHRPGEAGPFPLLNYDEVKRRAELILAVTGSGYMPPWLPEHGYGEFAEERRLTQEQISLISNWIEQGKTEGDPQDLPAVPVWVEGWQLGEPDLVLAMPEPFTLPAEGQDVFRNFTIPVSIPTTRYVRGLEFRPGNARIVHHARISLDRTGHSRRRDEQDPEPGFSGSMLLGESEIFDPEGHWLGWTPGKQPVLRPADMSWTLDQGVDFVLELHMLPTGKPETIQASVGLFFTDQPPDRKASIIRMGSTTMDIPPGERNYVIEDQYLLPVDVDVLNVYPHAHYLGKEMTSYAILPDDTKKWLLKINQWDFNWQDEYRYQDPVFLPKGSMIRMRFSYDNSAENPQNPSSPPQRVFYGWRTFEEMGDLWFQVVPRRRTDLTMLQRDTARKALIGDIAGYEKRLTIHPDEYETHNILGDAYLRLGHSQKALQHFQTSVRIEPGFPYSQYNLATLLDVQGRPREAIPHFQRALQAKPDYGDAHINLGNAMASLGRFTEAMRHYRAALELNPKSAAAHNNLGNVLSALGQSHEAARHYRQAIKIRPTYAEAHNNLGSVIGSQGDLDGAIEFFSRAVQLDPDYDEAARNLNKALEAREQTRP